MRTAEQILRDAEVIAVVGASREAWKPSHSVPLQMMRHGWRIIPVNPFADEVFGVPTVPTLADIDEPVDLVNIFRPSADAVEIVRQAVAMAERNSLVPGGSGGLVVGGTGGPVVGGSGAGGAPVRAPAVWLQSGIVSAEARRIATEAGLDYVEDRCVAVERAVAGLSRLP